MAWGLLGLDRDSQIAAEAGTLSDDRSKIKNWDLGDRFRSAITGVSQEDILKGVAAQQVKDINNATAISQETILQGLGGTGIDTSKLGIQPGETETEHSRRLAGLRATAGAASNYALIDGADLSKITSGMTTQQINQLGQQQRGTNKKTAEEKITTETRRLEDRADDRYDMEVLRQDRKDARADLLRAQERKDSLELRRDNMNLEYARLSQADKYKAQDRKDKAIMMLLQGLGNLGAGFTI